MKICIDNFIIIRKIFSCILIVIFKTCILLMWHTTISNYTEFGLKCIEILSEFDRLVRTWQ